MMGMQFMVIDGSLYLHSALVQEMMMTFFCAASPLRMTICDVLCSGADTFNVDDDDD